MVVVLDGYYGFVSGVFFGNSLVLVDWGVCCGSCYIVIVMG